MSDFPKRIAFIGGGNMAEAILSGLIHKKTLAPNEIIVSEISPDRRAHLQQAYSVEAVEDNAHAMRQAKTVVLAVKPKHVFEINEELRPHFTPDHILISILAGQSIARLGEAFGNPRRIARVMPNLPAQVGRGVSAITFPAGLRDAEKQFVRDVLASVGEVVEVEEPLQDAVTAVSGSGPGYVFYLADHFIAAAIQQGIPPAVAKALVTETFAGAAQVLRERDDTPAELVKKVATPGGTTEAGLSALIDGDVGKILHDMVSRAAKRSKELNQA